MEWDDSAGKNWVEDTQQVSGNCSVVQEKLTQWDWVHILSCSHYEGTNVPNSKF